MKEFKLFNRLKIEMEHHEETNILFSLNKANIPVLSCAVYLIITPIL
jgi:hypothetical protein